MKSHPLHVSSNTSLPLAIRDTFPSWISYAHMKVCISILPLKKNTNGTCTKAHKLPTAPPLKKATQTV